MLKQAAVSSAKTEDGGLLQPLKVLNWVLPVFWDRVDGVECQFYYGKGLGQVQSWLRTVLLFGGKIG